MNRQTKNKLVYKLAILDTPYDVGVSNEDWIERQRRNLNTYVNNWMGAKSYNERLATSLFLYIVERRARKHIDPRVSLYRQHNQIDNHLTKVYAKESEIHNR